MPGKRISVAAGLKAAQGPTQKALRSGTGLLVACVRRWGCADWVFTGGQMKRRKLETVKP